MKLLPNLLLFIVAILNTCSTLNYDEKLKNSGSVDDKQLGYIPHGPLVKCSFL